MPTRIRVSGDLQPKINFEVLARNLARRFSLLAANHGRKLFQVDSQELVAKSRQIKSRDDSLSWFDWERYSNRQKTRMKLGGVVGEMEFQGEALPYFLPLLVAGEILHVELGPAFGLGRYEIVA